mgnify:CR=1 FL=1
MGGPLPSRYLAPGQSLAVFLFQCHSWAGRSGSVKYFSNIQVGGMDSVFPPSLALFDPSSPARDHITKIIHCVGSAREGKHLTTIPTLACRAVGGFFLVLSWLWLFTSVTPRNVEKPSNWTPSIYMHSASFVISSVAVLIVLFTNVMGGSSSNAFGSFLSMAGVVTSAISVRFVIPFLSRHNKQGIYEMEGIIGFTCSPGDCCCPGATGVLSILSPLVSQ